VTLATVTWTVLVMAGQPVAVRVTRIVSASRRELAFANPSTVTVEVPALVNWILLLAVVQA
jgi:hypothetical protein